MTATTFKNQHQFSRLCRTLGSWIFPDLLLYPTGSIWISKRSFRISTISQGLTRSFQILPGPGLFPISPVLTKSLLISPDLLRTLSDLCPPDITRIFPNIAEYFRIFRYHSGSPDDRAWDEKV